MGNSGSAAAAVAASGAVQAKIKKEKKRAKKFGCCCCWCNVGAIVCIVVGIALLVLYAASLGDKVWPDDESVSQDVAKGLTYAGIALLILGVILVLIAVIFAIALWVSYRKINGKTSHKVFTPKQYAPGSAPYPQQEWGDVPDPHQSATAPEEPGSTAVNIETVKPEIH